MSFSQSQDALYKDKCLHVILNVLLSKIQRLESEVARLNTLVSNKQTTDTMSTIKKRVDMLELRQNTATLNDKHSNDHNTMVSSNLDAYLSDIDLVEDFQLEALNMQNNKQLNDKK